MMIKVKKAILCIFMCLVLMLSFAACKNKDSGADTTAPAENTAEDTTSSLEDIINALNGVDTTDSSNHQPLPLPAHRPAGNKALP